MITSGGNRNPAKLDLGAGGLERLRRITTAWPEPPIDGRNSALSIVVIIAPLLFAGAMVSFAYTMYYALFAVLSPVMAIGSWLDSRQRNRKAVGTGNQQFAAELSEFRTARSVDPWP
ncbi:MAG: hypothetical protein ACRDRO_03720 [Pseudonocardiaceae bacterium]